MFPGGQTATFASAREAALAWCGAAAVCRSSRCAVRYGGKCPARSQAAPAGSAPHMPFVLPANRDRRARIAGRTLLNFPGEEAAAADEPSSEHSSGEEEEEEEEEANEDARSGSSGDAGGGSDADDVAPAAAASAGRKQSVKKKAMRAPAAASPVVLLDGREIWPRPRGEATGAPPRRLMPAPPPPPPCMCLRTAQQTRRVHSAPLWAGERASKCGPELPQIFLLMACRGAPLPASYRPVYADSL